MRVFRYKNTDKTFSNPVVVFSGKFEECLDYYMNNKSKERIRGNYLEMQYYKRKDK
ncbi:MAG: hypothetical protein KHZ90_08365 [Veillonella parvula]|uniref:Uncharacterized protein n=1 Tax=Veillonella parvula TaxID=29466 RepID=A0A942WN51_VEIPA|nr:hypothetical protein [Veillonella parvula]MBS4893774.1 hypothetical protein [Veillonella parvula]